MNDVSILKAVNPLVNPSAWKRVEIAGHEVIFES